MAETLCFDPVKHRYTLHPSGVILPSVSEILAPVKDFSGIPPAVLEKARDRGTAVHKACELFDLGTLDEDDLDEQLVPYLAAWSKFMVDFKPDWTEIELPGYHNTLFYAGTPDRRGKQGGRGDRKRIVVDIKGTYSLDPAVSLQLSGYDLMGAEKCDELWSVRLLKDSTYVRTVHRAEHSTFLSCLNILRWKQKHA